MITSAPCKVVLENTKGRQFHVRGTYYGDATLIVDNPRPDRYAFADLVTRPRWRCEEDPKRLWWLQGKEKGEISPFRLVSVLLEISKKPSKSTVRKAAR